MENRCVVCGEIIPEGFMLCPCCGTGSINSKINSKNDSKVDHPSHYNQGKYECIDVMEDVFGVNNVKIFCRMNAFKYLWRFAMKNGEEDIKKARWYLNKDNELSEKQQKINK